MFSGAALQAKLHQTLSNSAAVVSAMGAGRVFDDVPNRQEMPYIVIGKSEHRNWDTSSENGAEHRLVFEIYSTENGRKQVFEVSDAVVEALDDVPSDLGDHHLVNLTFENLVVSRNAKREFFAGEITVRAVTEPK